MQVWEAHRILSQQIGDTVVCTSTAVPPDGVRYTRLMRDAYLYRAMLNRIEKALQIASSVYNDRNIASKILSPLFSDMVVEATLPFGSAGFAKDMTVYQLALDTLTPKPAYIFNITATQEDSGVNHDFIPVPIRNYSSLNQFLNGRNVQRPDPFAILYSHPTTPYLRIYSDGITLAGLNMTISYLPFPVDPSTQSGNVGRLTERVGQFQLSMLNTVLGLATLYAKMDDQETGSLERFGPQLLEMEIASNINVNGNSPQ